MILGSALCNNSTTQHADDGTITVLGDAADTALHHLLQDELRMDPDEYRTAYPRLSALPFNSKNKFMIVCHRTPEAGGKEEPSLVPLMNPAGEAQVVCCLMRAEVVLQRCSALFVAERILRKDVQASVEVPLTDELKRAVLDKQDGMGRAGL